MEGHNGMKFRKYTFSEKNFSQCVIYNLKLSKNICITNKFNFLRLYY